MRNLARAPLLSFVTLAACCLLPGCASKAPPPSALNHCPPNRPGCQIEVVFQSVGLGERVARLDNRLSAEQPAVTYLFSATAGEQLRLKLTGPAIRLVLSLPNGETVGPGLPPAMTLNAKGKYMLRVAANTMADDAYGEFLLEMRLIGKP